MTARPAPTRHLLIALLSLALAACSSADDNGGTGTGIGTGTGTEDGSGAGTSDDATPGWGLDDDSHAGGGGPAGGDDAGPVGGDDPAGGDDAATTTDAGGSDDDPDGLVAWSDAVADDGWSEEPDPPEETEGPDIAVEPLTHSISYISPLAQAIIRQVNISNLGDEPLHITGMDFTAGSSGDFSFVLKPPLPKTLNPGDWTMVQVRFDEGDGGPATLELKSNDADEPTVPVFFESSIKATIESPEPCGTLQPSSLNFGTVVRGNSKTLASTLSNCSTTETLKITKITRSQFFFTALTEEFQLDPEPVLPITLGPGEELDLNVTYTPKLAGPDAGHFAITTDDPAEPVLQLDVAAIGVEPPEEEIGLKIKLSWDTDSTDVDSHLLYPGAALWDCVLDCHYANPAPDWGTQGVWTDDPFLDVDDVDGYGPEHINISEPQAGTYKFAVHYFDDSWDGQWGVGDTSATVQVLSYGQVVATFGPQKLDSIDRVWDVFTVEWPPVGGVLNVTGLGGLYTTTKQACFNLFP